jgi:hypothetical protein
MAESIDLFLRDSSVSNVLGQRGRRRYEAMFSTKKIESTFVEAMATLG